jgi:hypothetical protein
MALKKLQIMLFLLQRMPTFSGSLFDNALSVTRLYSVDGRVTRGKNMHVLSEIRTHDLIVQAIKAYSSHRTATGTGGNIHMKPFYEWGRKMVTLTGQ